MRTRRRRARRLAAGALVDTCVVLQRGAGAEDEYGYQEPTYTDQAPCPCLVQMRTADEVAEQGAAEGVIYFGRDRQIAAADRIRVEARDGEPLVEPVVLQVSGPPTQQPSILLVQVNSVREQKA